EANYKKVEIDLIFKVEKAYYNVLKAEKICAVGKEAVEQLLAHLKVAENFYRAGMVPKMDLLKAQVQLADTEQKLVEAKNRLELARISFNNLLNRDLSAPVELVDISSYTPTYLRGAHSPGGSASPGLRRGGLEDSIEKAFSLRPELRAQEINLKIAKEDLRIAKSEYLPTISLITNYDHEKGSEIPIDKWHNSWNAVIAFELNIWNWGRTKEKVKQAKSVINQSQDSLFLLKNRIESEIRNAFLNLQSAEKRILVTEKAVDQSKEGLRMTGLRFKEGMATSTDVLDATTLRSQAETNYYQALYDCYLAEAALKRAMGEK
ncbi:MAG: TolC family protein, partial [Candidatus Omnitrophica bacterium]|nr:TolC family protein [Candidatus Omnitrophota bacterium]